MAQTIEERRAKVRQAVQRYRDRMTNEEREEYREYQRLAQRASQARKRARLQLSDKRVASLPDTLFDSYDLSKTT